MSNAGDINSSGGLTPADVDFRQQEAAATDGGGGVALTLTGTVTPIPGTSITVGRSGIYICKGIFDFSQSVDTLTACLGFIYAGGSPAPGNIHSGYQNLSNDAPSGWRNAWTMVTRVTVNAGDVINLRANKFLGAGSGEVRSGTTRLIIRQHG